MSDSSRKFALYVYSEQQSICVSLVCNDE